MVNNFMYNPDFESIIELATQTAINKNHEYVTLEHLLYAMVSKGPFAQLITSFGCNVDELKTELDSYLDNQIYLISKGVSAEPKKTHSLERVFNRAFTQVMFSGRQSLQVIDIFLSIFAEDTSYCKYLFQK